MHIHVPNTTVVVVRLLDTDPIGEEDPLKINMINIRDEEPMGLLAISPVKLLMKVGTGGNGNSLSLSVPPSPTPSLSLSPPLFHSQQQRGHLYSTTTFAPPAVQNMRLPFKVSKALWI